MAQRQGMAQRDQARGRFAGLNAGHSGDRQGFALGQLVGEQEFSDRRIEPKNRFGARHADGVGLARHVDHASLALTVQVAQPGIVIDRRITHKRHSSAGLTPDWPKPVRQLPDGNV